MPQQWEQTLLQLETSYFYEKKVKKMKHEEKMTIKHPKQLNQN